MNAPTPFRWLHLSDFHVGKDGYGEDQAFEQLVNHVDQQCGEGHIPNVLFLTGDLAQSGQPDQYEQFRSKLLDPLLDRSEQYRDDGWLGLTYSVPGNHDVDRDADASTRETAKASCQKFGRPTDEGVGDRRKIMPRFAAFHDIAHRFAGEPENWLMAPTASFADIIEHSGCRIGVTGLNTAWFCYDDDDYGELQAGSDIVRTAVKSLEGADVKILLGHHPLGWLNPSECEAIEKCLAEHHVIYLHGHLHRARVAPRFFRHEDYLTIQTGAAFQAHNDDKWVNGILLGEINTHAGDLRLQAREWDEVNE